MQNFDNSLSLNSGLKVKPIFLSNELLLQSLSFVFLNWAAKPDSWNILENSVL